MAGKIRGSAFAVTNKQYLHMVERGATVPHARVAGMKRVWSMQEVEEEDPSSGRAEGPRRRPSRKSRATAGFPR